MTLLDAMNTRYISVQEELRNAKNTLDMLTEQLEKQKIHYQVITGHHNELAFQLNEAKKYEGHPDVAPPLECVPATEPPAEQEHGEVNEQAEEQAA